MKLYEIKEEILKLESIEADGDQSLEEAIKNSLDDLDMEFEEKIENVVMLYKEVERDIDVIKAEVARLNSRKKQFENRIESMKQYVIDSMQALDRKTVKTAKHTISTVSGKDVAVIDDVDKLDENLVVIKVTEAPDKKAILKALLSGDVEGAHLEKTKTTLMVR